MHLYNVGDTVVYKNETYTVITVGYSSNVGHIYDLQSKSIPTYVLYSIAQFDLRAPTATAVLGALQSTAAAKTYQPLPKFIVGDHVLYENLDDVYIVEKIDPNGFFSHKITILNDPNRSYWVSENSLKVAASGTKLMPTGCQHEYKTYTGLFETYEYCSKCNEKKDDIVAQVAKAMVDSNSVQLKAACGGINIFRQLKDIYAREDNSIKQLCYYNKVIYNAFFGSNEEQ